MTLLKTSLLNGIAVLVKMLTLLGLNKILAVYVGPAGYAVVGQFQSAVQMISTFANGAVNQGVTKATAEYAGDTEQLQRVWRTAGTISLAGSVVTGFFLIVFSVELAEWFLADAGYASVFVWFAVTLVFFTSNALLLAVLNGKKEIGRFIVANIAGSLFALLVTGFLSVKFGLYGALVALAVYQSLAFFITLFVCLRADWFRAAYFIGAIDRRVAKELAKYTAMALAAAVCVPLSHIFVRNFLGDTLSWAAAGYWEAMWRLSAAYLLVVTTTLGVYFLPKFAELNRYEEIKREIIGGYKLILPVVAVCSMAVYLMRDLLVQVLFTQDFAPMRVLFGWQLFGDTLKIGSWLLAYLMIGKAMFRLFIVLEIAFSATFVGLVVLLTEVHGLMGASLAHAINYGAYWLVMVALLPPRLRAIESSDSTLRHS